MPSISRSPSRICPDTPASCHPPGSPPSQGRAYLSDTAGVVLGLGGGPEQAGGHRGRPQLQDPTEVRGVGGGSAGGGGRRRVGLLALGGQAELLGSPGEGRGGEGRGGRRVGRGGEGRRGRLALRAVLPPAPPYMRLHSHRSFPTSQAGAPGAGAATSSPWQLCQYRPGDRGPRQTRDPGPSPHPALRASPSPHPLPPQVPDSAAGAGRHMLGSATHRLYDPHVVTSP